MWSGALVTAGDVVFYGTMDGWFKAVDARTGKPLWQFKTGSGIIGQPVTYRGPDGKQYVAVLSGVGGWAGAIVAGGLDPRDSTRGARLRRRDDRTCRRRAPREARSTCSRCHETRRTTGGPADRWRPDRTRTRVRVAVSVLARRRCSSPACRREERRFREIPPSATPTTVRVSALQPGTMVDTTHVANPYENNAYAQSRGTAAVQRVRLRRAVTPTAAAAWARR